MIERMDSVVGRVLATIESTGHYQNTLVIFTSDNGGTVNARQAGLRGNKGSTLEGGIRVPAVVRWPGVIEEATTFTHPAVTFDLTVSLLRAARVTIPTGITLDGVDVLKSVAEGQSPPLRDLFWRQRRGERTWRAVREGALKYVSDTRGQLATGYLFDMATDPTEQTDLSQSRPDDVKRLQAKLTAWEQAVRPAR
jgi:N-acetylgalactosamine-6-sulfatase